MVQLRGFNDPFTTGECCTSDKTKLRHKLVSTGISFVLLRCICHYTHVHVTNLIFFCRFFQNVYITNLIMATVSYMNIRSYRRAANAQAPAHPHSLARAFAISTHTIRKRRSVRQKKKINKTIRHLANARLKNEFTEDEKYHNLMRRRICSFELLRKTIFPPTQRGRASVTLK